MKKILFVVGAILMIAACAKDEVNVATPDNGAVQTIAVNVEPFVNADTKTSVSITDGVATYSWSAGDQIGIYPVNSTLGAEQTSQQILFKLNGSGASTSATFTGTGWGLVTNGSYKYFSYYPYSASTKYNEAAVSFETNLTQTANGNADHLTGLDYLYTSQIQPESASAASFTFKHLTALVEFKITVPNNVKEKYFTVMTVTAPSALFTTAGTYDPSSATDEAAPTINGTATTDKLTLSLNGSTGFAPDSDGILHLYFFVAPAALSGQTLSIKLWDIDNFAYVASGTLTKDIKSNNFYILPFTAEVKPTTTAEDLSANGTANCYIVPENGKYMFKANIKGNGVVPSGMSESSSLDMTCCTAAVIWETVNTDTAPAEGAIVSNAEIDGDYIVFDATGAQGNALIALKNISTGEIVWSWHIWSTNADLVANKQTYGGANMMDRNLGALSAAPGDGLTLGFHYQWGRPCPITGGSSTSEGAFSSTRMATTNSSLWVEEETDATKGTLAYSTAHPTHFIYASASNYYKGQTSGSVSGSWLWTADSETGYTAVTMPAFWGSTKTMYDPCPIGWKVPASDIWTTAGFSTDTFLWNATEKGRTFTSPAAYYPASGYRGDGSTAQGATMSNFGKYGRYWTCSFLNSYGYFYGYLMSFSSSSITQTALVLAFGFSVRPCQE